MKIIFESHCGDDYFEAVGARKLQNSFKYFHPDIPLHIFGDAEMNTYREKYPWMNWASMDPILCGKFVDEYDMIVHIDADSIVTGTLDDILVGDFDIAGVRNNNDYGKASATNCVFGKHIVGINAEEQYLNAGLIASTNKEFWKEFLSANATMPEGGFGEQDVWNNIFWSGRYKSKLLDPKGVSVYYGIAAQLCERGEPMEASWQRMYMRDGKLHAGDGKVIKIIHNAGGFGLPKLQYQKWVNSEVRDFLDTITNTVDGKLTLHREILTCAGTANIIDTQDKATIAHFAADTKNYADFIIDLQNSTHMYDRFLSGRTDLTIIDLGANIGLFSLYAQPAARKLIAVEPTPTHFDILKKLTKKYSNIVPVKVAVHTVDGTTYLYQNPDNSTGNSTLNLYNNALPVVANKLITIMNNNGLSSVDFVKCDIEGGEIMLFTDEMLQELNGRVKEFYIECHVTTEPLTSELVNRKLLYDIFSRNGFDVEIIGGDALYCKYAGITG